LKVLEYVSEDGAGAWPLCANILDPVRASVVCSGPAQILQVFEWFTGLRRAEAGMDKDMKDANECAAASLRLPVCRVKNKFAFKKEELVGGYEFICHLLLYLLASALLS
jgi:hypothetical protein